MWSFSARKKTVITINLKLQSFAPANFEEIKTVWSTDFSTDVNQAKSALVVSLN